MEKNISIKTSNGSYAYQISEYKGEYGCYKYKSGFFSGSYDKIGKARSLEDAIAICKSHATQYGSVWEVKFD